MKCRRSFDLDLAAYLLDPRDAAWDEFRAHYPFCADCAAEVAAWTAVQQGLAQHPEPEQLLRWSDHPDSLDPATRATVAQHLERCPSCSDELRALAGFAASPALVADSAGAAAAGTAAVAAERAPHRVASELRAGRHGVGGPSARAPAARPPSKVGGRAGLRTLRRVLWHPALAYAALLVALLLPSFRARFDDAAGRPDLAHAPGGIVAPAAPAPASAAKPQQGVVAPPPQREGVAAPRDVAKSEQQYAEPPAALADRPPAAPPLRAEAEQRTARPAAKQSTLPEAAPAAVAPGRADIAREPTSSLQRAMGGVATQPSRADDGGASMHLSGASAAGLRTLVVTLPSGVVPSAAVEVRVRSESGDRELRDQVRPTPDGREVMLELPSGWLGEPRYLVEIYAHGALLTRGSVDAR